MTVNLEDVTIRSPRVLDKLRHYVSNIEQYKYFDINQHFKVFINDEKDFCAVESVEYALQFTSQDHKLIETILSHHSVDPVEYAVFRVWLNKR